MTRGACDLDRVKFLARELLIAIGEDPDREGLKDTPSRYANWWKEFVEYDPGKTETAFTSSSVDQMVIVSNLRVWTLCEHHLLPFWCDVSVGYITDGKMLGLSKFARIAHKHAHKLQVQERLVQDIASEVASTAQTGNVAVIGRGEHLCMTMRGIKSPGIMTSSVLRGLFRESGPVRDEFLKITLA